jgi:hypothetical protein
MRDENVVVDMNDKLKDCTQQSKTIIFQKLSATMTGG